MITNTFTKQIHAHQSMIIHRNKAPSGAIHIRKLDLQNSSSVKISKEQRRGINQIPFIKNGFFDTSSAVHYKPAFNGELLINCNSNLYENGSAWPVQAWHNKIYQLNRYNMYSEQLLAGIEVKIHLKWWLGT